MPEKMLNFSNSSESFRVAPQSVVCFQSEHNYTRMTQVNNADQPQDRRPLITEQLGKVEKALVDQLGEEAHMFARVSRQLVINLNYVFHVDVSAKTLELSDGRLFRLRLTNVAQAALKALQHNPERLDAALLREAPEVQEADYGELVDVATGAHYPLAQGRQRVGRKARTSAAEIQVETPGSNLMSREHLVVSVMQNRTVLVGLAKEGVAQTLLNGVAMTASHEKQLKHGDVISMPGCTLRYTLEDEEATGLV